MKILGSVALVLLVTPSISAHSTVGLDYILRVIKFQINIHGGVFSCVFWDVSPPAAAFDDTLDAILRAPQLDYVGKFVANGTDYANKEKLPRDPSMMIMNVGCDAQYLAQIDTKRNIFNFLNYFNPFTKLIIFVDFTNPDLVLSIRLQIYAVLFAKVIFYDSVSTHAIHCNGVLCWDFPKALQPIYLLTYGRRWYKGTPITYVINEEILPSMWNMLWIYETAEYLNTEAVVYKHNCSKYTGYSFYQCLPDYAANQTHPDISLLYLYWEPTNISFAMIFTTLPLHYKIAVPRDRPLNVAELLVMPFSWQVWILLTTIFILSEVLKNRFPELFKNDPTLLAVCGFERHDLNQTGRLEKLLFLSLIILMFFMTNAFETKIVSLMISKPAIQQIQTLEDLAKSNLRFHEDLKANPHFANHPIIGGMVVQGEVPWFSETVPMVAMLWYSEHAETRQEVSFDYQRMQPFYVLLDYEFNVGPEAYEIRYRDIFAEPLLYVHLTLAESGLMLAFKGWWKHDVKLRHLGRRPRKVIENKVELDFEDMQPAWMVLLVGLIVSAIGCLGEKIKHRFEVRKPKIGTNNHNKK